MFRFLWLIVFCADETSIPETDAKKSINLTPRDSSRVSNVKPRSPGPTVGWIHVDRGWCLVWLICWLYCPLLRAPRHLWRRWNNNNKQLWSEGRVLAFGAAGKLIELLPRSSRIACKKMKCSDTFCIQNTRFEIIQPGTKFQSLSDENQMWHGN